MTRTTPCNGTFFIRLHHPMHSIRACSMLDHFRTWPPHPSRKVQPSPPLDPTAALDAVATPSRTLYPPPLPPCSLIRILPVSSVPLIRFLIQRVPRISPRPTALCPIRPSSTLLLNPGLTSFLPSPLRANPGLTLRLISDQMQGPATSRWTRHESTPEARPRRAFMALVCEAEGRPACRFCFGDEGDLVEPCNCRGTQVRRTERTRKGTRGKCTPERGGATKKHRKDGPR